MIAKKHIISGRRTAIILMMVAGFFSLNGCKKKNVCKADSGGNLNVVLNMKHHDKEINGTRLMMKFSATELPGTAESSYDRVYQLDNNSASMTISGLTCGDYYFYATGIDSSLAPDNWVVKGGTPFSTDAEDGTIYLTVPVTEVH